MVSGRTPSSVATGVVRMNQPHPSPQDVPPKKEDDFRITYPHQTALWSLIKRTITIEPWFAHIPLHLAKSISSNEQNIHLLSAVIINKSTPYLIPQRYRTRFVRAGDRSRLDVVGRCRREKGRRRHGTDSQLSQVPCRRCPTRPRAGHKGARSGDRLYQRAVY